MIDPPRVLSEEPTAVTPHGGICGGESQQWLSYPTCERKAGMSLPVKVWSVQSRAGRTGASLAGVAATRGPKRRQRLDGVWN